MNKSNYQRRSCSTLSEKERRIVDLLVAGLSNRAIAQATNRTEATVKFHLKSVFQKLGVNSRVQVILFMANPDNRIRPLARDQESHAGV